MNNKKTMINREQLIGSNQTNVNYRLFPNIHKSVVKDTEHWVLKLETIIRFKYKRTYYLMKCINTNIINSPTDHQHIVIILEEFIKEIYNWQQRIIVTKDAIGVNVFKDDCQITEVERLNSIK